MKRKKNRVAKRKLKFATKLFKQNISCERVPFSKRILLVATLVNYSQPAYTNVNGAMGPQILRVIRGLNQFRTAKHHHTI